MTELYKTGKKFKMNGYLAAGLILTGFVLLVVITGIVCPPYEITFMDAGARLQGCSLRHLLGTDNLGRDILSRVMFGSRVTLVIAGGTVAIGAVIGIIIGALTGYFGGIADEIVMRICDALLAFPSILLALVFVSLFESGTFQVMIALGVAFIPSFARIVRSETARFKNTDFVENARLQGASNLRIIFVHILPNLKTVLMSSILIGFNNAVLAEASLSYLGIGSQPPMSSLGNMLSDAQSYVFTLPSYVLAPGAMIVIMVLGFAFLGEGVRKASK